MTSDRSIGIRTARAEQLDRMTVAGDNLVHATRYEATPHGVLEDMLLSLDVDFCQYTFVDLGAGKGRILCLASRFPFRAIVGVEFAKELYEAAQDNLQSFSAPWQRTRRISVVHRDVTRYRPPETPLIMYLFNPFRAPILGRVLANLERTLEADPRPAYLLYYMPEEAIVLDRSPLFQRIAAARNWIIYAGPS